MLNISMSGSDPKAAFMHTAQQIKTIAERSEDGLRSSYIDALAYQGKQQILSALRAGDLSEDLLGVGEMMAHVIKTLPPYAAEAVCDMILVDDDITDNQYAMRVDNAIREIIRHYSDLTDDQISRHLIIDTTPRLDQYLNVLGGIIETEHHETSGVQDHHINVLYLNDNANKDPWAILQSVFEALGERLATQRLKNLKSDHPDDQWVRAKDLQNLYHAMTPYPWGFIEKQDHNRTIDDFAMYHAQPTLQAAKNAVMAMQHIGFTDPRNGRPHKTAFKRDLEREDSYIRYIESCVIKELADPTLKSDKPKWQLALEMTQKLESDQLAHMDIRVKALLCSCLLNSRGHHAGDIPQDVRRAGKKIIQNTRLPATAEARLKRINGDFMQKMTATDGFESMVHNWGNYTNDQIDTVLRDITDAFCHHAGIDPVQLIIFSDQDNKCSGYQAYIKDYDVSFIALNADKLHNFHDIHDTFSTLFHELGAHGVLVDFTRKFKRDKTHAILTDRVETAEECFVLLDRVFYTTPAEGHEHYRGQLEEITANNIGAFMADMITKKADELIELERERKGYYPMMIGREIERAHRSSDDALSDLRLPQNHPKNGPEKSYRQPLTSPRPKVPNKGNGLIRG